MLESEGFEHGCNEPCAFRHEERDLVDLLYVDDNLYDCEEDDIQWTSDKLVARFKCKMLDWLSQDSPLDHQDMWISKSIEYHNLGMHKYTMNHLITLWIEDSTPVDNPMIEPIDGSSEKLDARDTGERKHIF